MAQTIEQRTRLISPSTFRGLLRAKMIRPASLEDVHGTHHTRGLYRHPNTGAFFVKVPKPAEPSSPQS